MEYGHLSMVVDMCQWVFSGCSMPATKPRSFVDESGSPMMGGSRATRRCPIFGHWRQES
jgi:hypothetical protein